MPSRLVRALGAPAVDVRFVGGCVRDSLIGKTFTEYDLGTPETPAQVMARLESAGVKVFPTGLDHGTVTAVIDKTHFEITTLRRDTACDGRHAAVEFTTDWREDAGRRDFTINAMSVSPSGEVFDYFGGRKDLQDGRIFFVGAAADRIKEDYLRILRLFRFYAHYGHTALDAQTLEACARLKEGIGVLSAERVRLEVMKLLQAMDPLPSLQAMDKCGVLAIVLPGQKDMKTLIALLELEKAFAIPLLWTRRLAALLSPEINVEVVASLLRLTNKERDSLIFMSAAEPALPDDGAGYDLLLYRHGKEPILDRILLKAARRSYGSERTDIERAVNWVHKPMPLGGNDLLTAGFQPGPSVGAALRRAEKLWVSSGFTASQEQLKAEAKNEAGPEG